MTSVEKDLRILRESKANLEGKATQTSVNISTAIAVIGVMLGLASFIFHYVAPAGQVAPPAIVQPF
jgi:hypothetical protein